MSILKNRRKKRRLEFYKRHETDQVWWVSDGQRGPLLVSFDGETVFNLWIDYPHNLTKEQKELFDKENPFWEDFFKSRCK